MSLAAKHSIRTLAVLLAAATAVEAETLETRRSMGSGGDGCGGGPAIEGGLGPGRHRDGADAAVLADQIHDRP